jgi:hypothetical protein
MYEVTEVPLRGITQLWFSARVWKAVEKFGDPGRGRFWMQLQRCCQNGFAAYERIGGPVVKHEWDGVYRVGFNWSLFRIIGFYADGSNKSEFICIDALEKSGQKLKAPERQRIDEVVKVRRNHLWVKRPNDKFPRIAQDHR